MIRSPPTTRIQSRLSKRNRPAAENDAPSATKIIEKPTMKARECRRIRPRVSAVTSSVRALTDIPVMNDRYDGKSGRTQGERNEKSPALKATKTPSECAMSRSALAGGEPVLDLGGQIAPGYGPDEPVSHLPIRPSADACRLHALSSLLAFCELAPHPSRPPPVPSATTRIFSAVT